MDGQKRHRHNEPWPPDWPDIKDRAVLAALEAVPCHLFVPARLRSRAYEDVPLPIGDEQTISQPYIVALMTQALRLHPGSHVLEVGTGSGYQAAVLAQLTPHVFSVEVRPALAAAAAHRLHGLGLDVQVKVGDGTLGWAEHAPYQGIIVTAAGRRVPAALAAQLANRGRLVIPVGDTPWDQRLWLFKRIGCRLQARLLAEVRFVPLVTAPCDPSDAAAVLPFWRILERFLRRTVMGNSGK